MKQMRENSVFFFLKEFREKERDRFGQKKVIQFTIFQRNAELIPCRSTNHFRTLRAHGPAIPFDAFHNTCERKKHTNLIKLTFFEGIKQGLVTTEIDWKGLKMVFQSLWEQRKPWGRKKENFHSDMITFSSFSLQKWRGTLKWAERDRERTEKRFSVLIFPLVSKLSFFWKVIWYYIRIRCTDHTYRYLSWTFCLMSAKFSDVISRSKYSDSFSVADSKSFWFASNINDWLFLRK